MLQDFGKGAHVCWFCCPSLGVRRWRIGWRVRPARRSRRGFDRGADRDGTRLAFAVAADMLAVAPRRVSSRQFREGDGRLRADDQRIDEARAGQSFNPNAGRALRLVLLFPPAGSGADRPAQSGAGSA